MDYVSREFIFFFCSWLSLGALSDWVQPFPLNRVVVTGSRNVSIMTCYNSANPKRTDWRFISPIQKEKLLNKDPDYDVIFDLDAKSTTLIIKIVNVTTVGWFTCTERTSLLIRFIYLMVLDQPSPTCDFTPKDSKFKPGDQLQLSCSLRFTVQQDVISPNFLWSSPAWPKPIPGTMTKSTVDTITTGTSTLSVTIPKNSASTPVYTCWPTFEKGSFLEQPYVAKNIPIINAMCTLFEPPTTTAQYETTKTTTVTPKVETTSTTTKVETTTAETKVPTTPATTKAETTKATMKVETTPASIKVETTTAETKVSTTPSKTKLETTMSETKVETHPATTKVETTTAGTKVETTTAGTKVETTTAGTKVETTTAETKVETTTARSKDVTETTISQGTLPNNEPPECHAVEKTSYMEFETKSHGKCVSEQPVNQSSCIGICYGQQQPTLQLTDNSELVMGNNSCTCCQPGIIVSYLDVIVECQLLGQEENKSATVKMEYFTDCSCRECPEEANETTTQADAPKTPDPNAGAAHHPGQTSTTAIRSTTSNDTSGEMSVGLYERNNVLVHVLLAAGVLVMAQVLLLKDKDLL